MNIHGKFFQREKKYSFMKYSFGLVLVHPLLCVCNYYLKKIYLYTLAVEKLKEFNFIKF